MTCRAKKKGPFAGDVLIFGVKFWFQLYLFFCVGDIFGYFSKIKGPTDKKHTEKTSTFASQNSLYDPSIGDGHPTFDREYDGYINPYYKVDDHPYHTKPSRTHKSCRIFFLVCRIPEVSDASASRQRKGKRLMPLGRRLRRLCLRKLQEIAGNIRRTFNYLFYGLEILSYIMYFGGTWGMFQGSFRNFSNTT